MAGNKNKSGKGSTGAAAPFAQPKARTVRPAMMAPQPQRLSPDNALAQAARLQEAGRLKEAEALLRQIVSAQPKNAHAWHMLGMTVLAEGNAEAAAEFVTRAIACDGKVALFHANLAEIHRQRKHLAEAIAAGERAVAVDPAFPLAHRNLGVAYFDNKEYDKAEACQRAALKIKPDFAPALNNLGSVLRAKGDDDGALECYRKAVSIKPDYFEAANNVGATLLRLGRAEEALDVFNGILARRPNYATALCNKGLALAELERGMEALECFGAAQRLRPDLVDTYVGAARVHRDNHVPELAEASARKAVELAPQNADAWNILGSVLADAARNDEAREAFGKALESESGHRGARMSLGTLALETGKLSDAEEIFRSLVAEGKDAAGALAALANARKMKPGDPEIALLEREVEKNPSGRSAISLRFALGKAYADTGRHEEAFPLYIEGGRLKRARVRYDADETDSYFARLREIFTAEFIAKHKGAGFESDVPVFVLGMPRSGTTLTEQIIASHPDVHGAGEILDLLDLNGSRAKADETPFPENMLSATDEALRDIGKKYAAQLSARAPKAKRVTDKLPVNFMNIGLIHVILPQAKIIHVSRHPLDTCISCFTQLFRGHNQEYTYDLAELGRYYRNYSLLMDHWRQVLPPGAFLDMRYEDLIADTETQARRLLDYCGLSWNDRCLEFYKTERNVHTASVTQVRQPVYKSSVQRWRKYEKFLGPLKEALGEALPPDDR